MAPMPPIPPPPAIAGPFFSGFSATIASVVKLLLAVFVSAELDPRPSLSGVFQFLFSCVAGSGHSGFL
jgi:hypothetical protein